MLRVFREALTACQVTESELGFHHPAIVRNFDLEVDYDMASAARVVFLSASEQPIPVNPSDKGLTLR